MKFGSVCSGIEAASVAWGPLGWKAAWLSEIEPFPSAVLKHHYPDVPNLGDMTLLPDRIASGEVEAPDLFCGGTPCQAFSVAGLRKSLDDSRGNLSLVFCEIANAIDTRRLHAGLVPGIIFWENVPGVLSTNDNAFGCFLAGLAGEDGALEPPGGKWTNAGCVYGPQRTVAWRVLDAQYFGVAQRRRRVFVVASARDGFDPAKVLFEFDGVRRDTAPSREAGERVAPCVTNGPPFSRTGNERVEAEAIITMAHGQGGAEIGFDRGPTLTCNHEAPIITHSLRGEGFDDSEDGTGRGTPLVPVAQPIALQDVTPREKAQNGKGWNDDGTSYTVDTHATQGVAQPMAFDWKMGEKARSIAVNVDQAPTLGAQADRYAVSHQMAVRRLTPMECERLQGFPDGYTAIPWRKKPAEECPDGPRYKALGNSWAVPVVRWIGARIAAAVSF